eukprot:2908671-Rhodomonas_salina.4
MFYFFVLTRWQTLWPLSALILQSEDVGRKKRRQLIHLCSLLTLRLGAVRQSSIKDALKNFVRSLSVSFRPSPSLSVCLSLARSLAHSLSLSLALPPSASPQIMTSLIIAESMQTAGNLFQLHRENCRDEGMRTARNPFTGTVTHALLPSPLSLASH